MNDGAWDWEIRDMRVVDIKQCSTLTWKFCHLVYRLVHHITIIQDVY